MKATKLGWPWLDAWLNGPRAQAVTGSRPPGGSDDAIDYPGHGRGEGDSRAGREAASSPPFSLEVAGVEVAGAEDPDAAHVEVSAAGRSSTDRFPAMTQGPLDRSFFRAASLSDRLDRRPRRVDEACGRDQPIALVPSLGFRPFLRSTFCEPRTVRCGGRPRFPRGPVAGRKRPGGGRGTMRPRLPRGIPSWKD